VWDARSGTTCGVLHGHEGAVRGVALSADGRRAALEREDRTIRLWDMPRSSRRSPVLPAQAGWASAVGLSSDGTRLVAGAEGEFARVWCIESTTATAVLRSGSAD
jgi:WD40 repeat protein